MKSLPPRDYQSLLELAAPAGYILVIRDIDSDSYRIDGAADPKTYIAAVCGQTERRFGIELVAILQTDDLAASESELYDRHQARLSGEWLRLDPYQLEELRRSALQIDARASLYLTPSREAAPENAGRLAATPRRARQLSRYETLAGGYLRGSQEAADFRRAFARQPNNASKYAYRRYGAGALRSYREGVPDRPQLDSGDPFAVMLHLSARAEEFFATAKGKVVKFILVLLLIVFLYAIRGSR